MLFKLFNYFQTDISWLNVFRYITFRTILSALTSLTAFFILGNWAIDRLRDLQIGQYIREDGPPNHKIKEGTPTMGGCIILPIIMTSVLLWSSINNAYIWLTMLVIFGYGVIGFLDDFLKIRKKNGHGLTAKAKITFQILVALVVTIILYNLPGFDSRLNVPFLKSFTPDLGLWYIPLATFIIVGSSNAVNLTDGLDGLAIGPIIVAFTSFMIFSYIAGHSVIASYLQIPYVAGAGELSIFCGAVAGAGLGFLWYNAYPAEVFMGDVGSLPLGAVLGTVAVITKQELLLVLVGGIFVVEALSVIFQVSFFKITGGQRIFRMAPIHHHFELKGWAESKVTVRFWIIAIILSLLSISTLKLR
jgi:phospho-N-acetylmuramoyl-pentapeptide-transferase